MSTIARAVYANPNTGQRMAFSTTTLGTHRKAKRALVKLGYLLEEENEEIADFATVDDVLAVAQMHMPLD